MARATNPASVAPAVVVYELLTGDNSAGCVPQSLMDDLRVRAGADCVVIGFTRSTHQLYGHTEPKRLYGKKSFYIYC
jgi:hypothetical protein